jgi:hypothetical protein
MIERKIIIGLISSTEYCEKVKDIWNIQLLESAAAKLIAGWAWEYFIKYSKAPGHEIETIYYSKLKDGKIQKNLAEEIEEDILPGLSAESTEEDVNLQYLIEETEKYFSSQHLKQLSDNVQALIAAGRISEANDLAIKFKPLDKVTVKLEDFILTVQKIREKGRPHPTILMKPWLREGQTTIIYGNYGSGKSLLAIAVAYMLGLRDYKTEDCEMGEWFIKNPTGTLYIDGELGEQEMDDRVQCFEWLGSQKYKMEILSVPEYQLSTGDTFYLSSRINQLKIIKWLKEHPRYKLTVLDSASTLFGLENENDNSEWNNKVNPFLRDLRALGVACLLLHHAGKDNKRGLRGASAMGAMAHNIFRLTIPKEKDIDEGEAWFTLSKDKQRAKGFMFKKFSLHFTQNEEQTETHWEIT